MRVSERGEPENEKWRRCTFRLNGEADDVGTKVSQTYSSLALDMRKRFPGSEVSMDFNSGAQTCHKMTRLTSLVQIFLQTDIHKKCRNPFRKPPKIAVQSALAHMIASGV